MSIISAIAFIIAFIIGICSVHVRVHKKHITLGISVFTRFQSINKVLDKFGETLRHHWSFRHVIIKRNHLSHSPGLPRVKVQAIEIRCVVRSKRYPFIVEILEQFDLALALILLIARIVSSCPIFVLRDHSFGFDQSPSVEKDRFHRTFSNCPEKYFEIVWQAQLELIFNHLQICFFDTAHEDIGRLGMVLGDPVSESFDKFVHYGLFRI
mmetsp:Transcript_19134/g.33072  ORF Transcript_19134/g.33072 Transcript_19134/m.33072 type:complete len:210 (+) Transcript_19134:294-923(+)